MRDGPDDRLSPQVEDEPEHAVRGRVLGAHVERELAELALDDLELGAHAEPSPDGRR